VKLFHPILLVVNILPGNTQVNKENQLTKETVSVPVLLKVILYFTFFAYLFCVFNNHDQSAINDEVPPTLHRTWLVTSCMW